MINGIGFAGRMMSGKDTAASFIDESSISAIIGTKHLAFASPFKEFCINELGLAKDLVYTQEGKKTYIPEYGKTVRQILQDIGQGMREKVHPDIWIFAMKHKLQECINNKQFFLVTDIRYENEANLIHEMGGIVVRIDRPSVEPKDTSSIHISEQKLPNKFADHIVLNDGTLEEFKSAILSLLKIQFDCIVR